MNEADFIAFKKVLGAVVTRLMGQGASPDEAARLAYSMFERDYPALMAGLAVYADQALQQVEGVGK
jgi:hypothetical protein